MALAPTSLPPRDQRLDRGDVPAAARAVERRPRQDVPGADVAAPGDQLLDDGGVAPFAGLVQRRPVALVLGADVGALGEESSHPGQVPGLGRVD